jgi:hypothetical protein
VDSFARSGGGEAKLGSGVGGSRGLRMGGGLSLFALRNRRALLTGAARRSPPLPTSEGVSHQGFRTAVSFLGVRGGGLGLSELPGREHLATTGFRRSRIAHWYGVLRNSFGLGMVDWQMAGALTFFRGWAAGSFHFRRLSDQRKISRKGAKAQRFLGRVRCAYA